MGDVDSLVTILTGLASFGLTWVLQSSALLGLGLLAGRILRNAGPAVQSAIYRTALATVLLCPLASGLLGWAGLGGLNVRIPIPIPSSVTLDSDASVAVREFVISGEPGSFPERESGPMVAVLPAAIAGRPQPGAPAPLPPRTVDAKPIRAPGIGGPILAMAVGLACWLLGGFVLAVRLIVGQRRMARARASSLPAGHDERALCTGLALSMKLRPPEVLRSPFLFSPCLDGVRRPAILLPEDAGEDLRDTFVHELAHLARHDGLWNMFRRWAVALFWWQPLLWILSRRLEAAAEDVCDDFVVHFGADRARYAGHLLELAGRALPPTAPAAIGMVSLRSMLARRVVRILDTSRSLSTRAGRRAVAGALVTGIAGTLLAGLLGVGSPARNVAAQAQTQTQTQTQTKSRSQEPTKAKAGDRAEVESKALGLVVGPDGEPLPGATIVVLRSSRYADGIHAPYMRRKVEEILQFEADRGGHFMIPPEIAGPDPLLDPGRPGSGLRLQVVARAPGFALGYYQKGKPITLLRDEQPISGRVVDLEGRPVARATVRIHEVTHFEPEARRELASSRKGEPAPTSRGTIPVEPPSPPPGADPSSSSRPTVLEGEGILPGGIETDAQGRFRIEGLPRGDIAILEISGPKVAMKRVKVVARQGERMVGQQQGGADEYFSPRILHGADCTIAVEPMRVIEGTVRDIASGEPLPGVVVTAGQVSGSLLGVDGLFSAVTDTSGRYQLLGLPKDTPGDHKLSVYPTPDQPYFITRRLAVSSGPGLEPVRFDIKLRRGVWIVGQVKDARTGKPAAGSVDYFPLLANAHARDYPNFVPGQMSLAINTRHRTDREGRFRIVGLPGRGVVTVRADSRAYRVGAGAEAIRGRTEFDTLQTYDRITPSLYHALKEIEIPEGLASATCDMELDPGGSVRVRLVDESGGPVTGVFARGRYPRNLIDGDPLPETTNETRIVGLDPGKSRTALFVHRKRKIGAALTIPADGPRDDREVTVTLRPAATVTGRLVDAKGNPATGNVRVMTSLGEGSRSSPTTADVASATADAEGRFRCEGLPPGAKYVVQASARPMILGMSRTMRAGAAIDVGKPFALSETLELKPGEVIDLGTFDVDGGKRIGAPGVGRKEPPASPEDVPISGRIVDLEGRPVAGVRVSLKGATRPRGDSLTPWIQAVRKREPPWTAYAHLGGEVELPASVKKEVMTDEDGRFRLKGLGADRVVSLNLVGETVPFIAIQVVTRRIDPVRAEGFSSQYGPGTDTIYGAEFTLTSRPGRIVEGLVRDAKTGHPLPGVELRSYRFAGSDYVGTMPVRSKADSRGKFRLVGLPKGKKNILIAVPNDEQPYFMREVDVPDPEGLSPVSITVDLHRGIWIQGKVAERATGTPVAGARLHYLPFLKNTFARATPEFHEGGNTDGTGFQERYVTRSDGTFRLVGLPGRAIVGVMAHPSYEGVQKHYRQGSGSEAIKDLQENGHFPTWGNPIPASRLWPTSMKEIDPPAGADSVRVDLQLEVGASVKLRLVDPDGTPVSEVRGAGRVNRGDYDRGKLTGPEVEVINLVAGEERLVRIWSEARKLGKVVTVREGDDRKGPVVVTLVPFATIVGRVADGSGNPVPGAIVRPDLLPSGSFSLHLPEVVAGDDGRFHVPDVPTGCKYRLNVESGVKIRSRRFASSGVIPVEAGKTVEIGNLTFKGD